MKFIINFYGEQSEIESVNDFDYFFSIISSTLNLDVLQSDLNIFYLGKDNKQISILDNSTFTFIIKEIIFDNKHFDNKLNIPIIYVTLKDSNNQNPPLFDSHLSLKSFKSNDPNDLAVNLENINGNFNHNNNFNAQEILPKKEEEIINNNFDNKNMKNFCLENIPISESINSYGIQERNKEEHFKYNILKDLSSKISENLTNIYQNPVENIGVLVKNNSQDAEKKLEILELENNLRERLNNECLSEQSLLNKEEKNDNKFNIKELSENEKEHRRNIIAEDLMQIDLKEKIFEKISSLSPNELYLEHFKLIKNNTEEELKKNPQEVQEKLPYNYNGNEIEAEKENPKDEIISEFEKENQEKSLNPILKVTDNEIA